MIDSIQMTGEMSSLGDLLDGTSKIAQFNIPSYQRPYAWTTEQTSALFDDLYDAFKNNGSSEYFLGTIVLAQNPEEKNVYDVIDGQQRLTTLTILYSALASNVGSEMRDACRNKIFQVGDKSKGLKSCPRLKIRERHGDREFFEKYIQEMKINQLASLTEQKKELGNKTDSQKNVAENAVYLFNQIRNKGYFTNTEKTESFVEYLTQNVKLMVVKTLNKELAIRIFSVMNNRGLDLQRCDIFKAEILDKMDDETRQAEYAQKWEDLEDLVERKNFDKVLSHINTIVHPYTKNETTLVYLREKVLANHTPEQAIDGTFVPYVEAYHILTNQKYKAVKGADDVNNILYYLKLNKNDDWIPPAIVIYERYKNDPVMLLKFLKKLELLAAYLNASGKNGGQRLQRYQNMLLRCVKDKSPDSDFEENLRLTNEEITNFYEILNGNIYEMQKDRRKVLLMRIDSLISDGQTPYAPSDVLSHVTVEHVLPQNPSERSEWLKLWPDEEERKLWVHRLANLALLSRSKNSQASNYDFKKKINVYFSPKDGVASYNLTTLILKCQSWTPEIVKRRQYELLKRIWEKWEITTNFNILTDSPSVPDSTFPVFADDIFLAKNQHIVAGGYLTKDGRFVVLKGSQLYDYHNADWEDKRNELRKQKVLSSNCFLKDHEFKSPSTAAGVVMCQQTNGRTFWVRKNGVTVGDVMKQS